MCAFFSLFYFAVIVSLLLIWRFFFYSLLLLVFCFVSCFILNSIFFVFFFFHPFNCWMQQLLHKDALRVTLYLCIFSTVIYIENQSSHIYMRINDFRSCILNILYVNSAKLKKKKKKRRKKSIENQLHWKTYHENDTQKKKLLIWDAYLSNVDVIRLLLDTHSNPIHKTTWTQNNNDEEKKKASHFRFRFLNRVVNYH